MRTINHYTRFIFWCRHNISSRNLILLLSVVVGLVTSLSVVFLKLSTRTLLGYLTNNFVAGNTAYLYFTLPLTGILLSGFLIQYFNKGVLRKGIPMVIFSILKNNSRIPIREMPIQLLTSAVTVGFGGSVGLEGPSVGIGSTFGANLGQWFRLNARHRTLLMGCGAAAVTATLFNAPIAGVIFALEILMLELKVVNLLPILLASVTGAMISRLFFEESLLFKYMLNEPFALWHISPYIFLGILSGMVSVYFTRLNILAERQLTMLKMSPFHRAVFNGSMLGLLVFLLPPLFGDGYRSIRLLFANQSEYIANNSFLFEQMAGNELALTAFLLGILLLKALAIAFTIVGGGNGGIFAPSLLVGALTGFVYIDLLNKLLPQSWQLPLTNFTLVGMAGVMSGIMHAPLTAIFLIAEITGGYELLLPLMLVSSLGYATARYFAPYSIFAVALAKQGHWIAHDIDKQVLNHLNIERLIEKDLITLEPQQKLRDLLEAVSTSKRNVFPIIDSNCHLQGIVVLDDIRAILFKSELYDTLFVYEIMHAPPECVDADTDTMDSVMTKFEQSGAWNLPVVSQNRYVGLLSKSKIFSVYRRILIENAKE